MVPVAVWSWLVMEFLREGGRGRVWRVWTRGGELCWCWLGGKWRQVFVRWIRGLRWEVGVWPGGV